MSFPIFEALMIFCFGASWPFSILKSYRTKSVKGKSLLFLSFIWIGYVAGILHKVFFSMDPVIILYILNGILISVDIALYLRYRNNA
jgi:hypothetical protein